MLFYVFSINVDELNKPMGEGFGVYVDKNQMEKDKVLDQKKCFSAFIKNDIRDIDIAIFHTVGDTDCDFTYIWDQLWQTYGFGNEESCHQISHTSWLSGYKSRISAK